MSTRIRLAPLTLVFASALLLAEPASVHGQTKSQAPAKTDKSKEPEPEPLPPPSVRLWLIAPGPTELWTLRIDNEGTRPVRIPADVRLLELEIDVPVIEPEESASAPPAKKKPAAKKKPPKPVKCAAPNAMRPTAFPDQRELLLAPGESYIDTFDPRLLCFGKSADALMGGAIVRSRFGWAPPKVPAWAAKKKRKPPEPPFAAEGTDAPAVFAPAKQLSPPTIVLSYSRPHAAEPSAAHAVAETDAKTPPEGAPNPTGVSGNSIADAGVAPPEPIVDANAPRLEVKAQPFSDAAAPRAVSVTTTVKNAGNRGMLAVLRSRMIGFHIAGPDGELTCPAAPPTRAVPRDMYRTYKPGETTSFTTLLFELCPQGAFARPGIYHVTPTFFAQESGSEIGLKAYTAVVRSENASIVRVQTGPEPFYASSPKKVPTPKPVIPEAGAPGSEQSAE